MTQIPRVVVADPLSSGGIAVLREHLDVVEANDAAALNAALPEARGLIVRSRTSVTAEMLERSPRLEIVGRAGIGVDNIDVAAASDRGILVINAPLGNVRSTAEHTIALIFALARRIPVADRAVRDGAWKRGYEGIQLAGKRLGVIGAGKVGRQVAAIAATIGMHVVAHDPYLPEAAWRDMDLEPVTLPHLLHTSDVVTLHIPLVDETRGLLGRDELARMRSDAFLVNCARGGLVDEAALAEALAEGRLAGAAVDVFEAEPPVDSPLLRAPNVILTPHVAASTREAQAQVSMDIAQQIVAYFDGRSVDFPVNPNVLRKAAV